jgi:hypothetical protein
LRLLGGYLLLWGKASLLQRDVAGEVDLRVVEMGLVAGKIGLGLVELRLVRARIELGQQLAFIDGLAVLEVDADNRLCHHAANRRRVQRRDIADSGQHDREIFRLNCGGNDGDGRPRFRLR